MSFALEVSPPARLVVRQDRRILNYTGVADGPQSRIFDEAENRLHVQKAILLWLMGGAAIG